jgi:hypothetical protein
MIEQQHWVKKSYIECLKNYLPCECSMSEELEFPLILTDTENGVITLYENNGEVTELFLETNKNNQYNVYSNKEKKELYYSIEIIKDSLFLKNKNDNRLYTFIKFDTDLGKQREYKLGNLNSEILKRDIKELFDSLRIAYPMCLHCNKELEDINLFSSPSDCENTFILELHNNTYFLYKYENPCSSKIINIQVDKALIGKQTKKW